MESYYNKSKGGGTHTIVQRFARPGKNIFDYVAHYARRMLDEHGGVSFGGQRIRGADIYRGG